MMIFTKKIILIFKVILIATLESVSQNNYEPIKSIVDDSVRLKLGNFLVREERRDTIPPAIIINDYLTGKSLRKGMEIDGLCKFKISGPHSIPYLFYATPVGIKIIDDYSVENLLIELSLFLKGKTLSYEKKIQYLEKLPLFINERNE